MPLVYCLSERVRPHGEALRDAGVPLRVIGGGRLQRLRALRAALDEDRIDIVHAWLFVANAYACTARAQPGPGARVIRASPNPIATWVSRC